MAQALNIDGILLQWGDRLFYPGNRIVRARPMSKLSGLERCCIDAQTMLKIRT